LRTAGIWSYTQSLNTELIIDTLNVLSSIFPNNFETPIIGLYTTTTDLKIVTNLNSRLPQNNYYYWSALGDNVENCGSGPTNGFPYCYIQAQRNVSSCNYIMNVNIIRPMIEQ